MCLYLALVPAVGAATGQVLSTGSPVDHGHHTASCDTSLVVSGGVDCGKDDEMFITRSFNVMPKTTICRNRHASGYQTVVLVSVNVSVSQWK